PGWVLIGMVKMLLGSYLAYLMVTEGASYEMATNPTYMYQKVFYYLNESESLSLLLAALMVIICQMKINVTNAYAGSIAWSNFFSRLTHSHPGRVVWLVFNVTIALLLMELGIYQALEAVLAMFAIVAVSWLGSLAADLLINKPLGLSPKHLEFKRAHLYDINPVGCGSMVLATSIGLMCYLGTFGELVSTLSHFVALAVCFIAVPLIAWLTRGRYYLARTSPELDAIAGEIPLTSDHIPDLHPPHSRSLKCGVCENHFEVEDISFCPAYDLPICSLCCSLDVRCMDNCRPQARFSRQLSNWLAKFVSRKTSRWMNSRLGHFAALLVLINLLNAAMLALVFRQMAPTTPEAVELLQQTLWTLFFTLLIASGVISWLFLLAHESRVVAQRESNRQTRKLTEEIEAHKVTDQELQQARDHAEQANQAKTRYLSGISHELRTPLQSVLGYAQLLANRSDTPESHQHGLNTIRRSGQYLTDLIDGLLDISRIEAGKLELFRSRVELPLLLEQLQAMFSVQAQQKGIHFEMNIQDALPQWTMTDERRLRQILINLLSNAIKYTQQGEVVFEIRYRNQVAEFSIRDTGPGIEADALERVFNPFERVRDKATANLPGTGLGLTIVRLLTDIMGGDLKVASEPGQGSCFRVALMLPWVAAGEMGLTGDADQFEQQGLIGYEGYRRTLLVVDDDPVVRGLLSELLVPLGFEVLEAPTAEAALAMLDSQGPDAMPDLYLMDISMPGMNGLDCAAEIRQRGIQAPIVMLSADAAEQHRSKDEQAIYSAYLVKPVSNRDLLRVLGRLLKLEWSWQQNSQASSARSSAKEVPESASALTNAEPAPESTVQLIGQLPGQLTAPDNEGTQPVQAEHPLVSELITCIDMGYPKGIQQAIDKLEQEELLMPDQISALRQLARSYRFEAMLELVNKTR
ncbi:MAG: ATP-binding protein, partial [Oceanobacter sp.]